MIVLHLICLILVLIWIASIGPLICVMSECGVDEFEGWLNPVVMYESGEFNLFGVISLTIIKTIVLFPAAIIYWFYKLCTVGRR